MKKALAALLAILISLSCAACQAYPNGSDGKVTVYYRRADVTYGTLDGVVAPYQLDAAGNEDNTRLLLDAYLAGIPSSQYGQTYPRGTYLVSLKRNGLTASIVLCHEFATLSGLDLSIACACLTQTVISLTGCQEVIISAENASLDGHNFITLSRDSYLLLDESGGTD